MKGFPPKPQNKSTFKAVVAQIGKNMEWTALPLR
jgi:hypothetical protein